MRTLREILSEEKLILKKASESKNTSDTDTETRELDDETKRSLFYLLSKNFGDLGNKRYFLDQIELMILKKGIQPKEIKRILRKENMNLHVGPLFSDENDSSFLNKSQPGNKIPLNNNESDQKMLQLERVLTLYRADQLFAPLIKLVNLRMILFQRHFFVNTRFFAKLAPFRKVHSLVEHKLEGIRRGVWSQILFYKKPCVKLQLVCALVAKAKQRILANSFKEICLYFMKKLLMKQMQEQMQESKNQTKESTETKIPEIESKVDHLKQVVDKIKRKHMPWFFEKLKEIWVESYIEVEVVESEDCTQELLDIAGNINLTDTKFGDLRGVNKHLAKEKSSIFKEVDKFVSKYNQDEEQALKNQQALNGSLYAGINNSQFITSSGIHQTPAHLLSHLPRKSMVLKGFSPTINPFNDQPNLRTSRVTNSQVSPFHREKKHLRVKSAIHDIKLSDVHRLNSPDYRRRTNKSSNNLESLIMPSRFQNNELMMNLRESIIPKNYNQRARRGTFRDSVLQQYSKLLTKNKFLDRSITSVNGSEYNSFK